MAERRLAVGAKPPETSQRYQIKQRFSFITLLLL